MRIARALFIAALLLSGLTNTALAAGQGADRAVGYIRLVTKAEANVPLQTLTRNAFRRMLPALQMAQKRGQILDFEVSPSSGVLEVTYRPSTGLSSIAGNRIYAHGKDALAPASLLKAAMAPARAIATAGTGFFDMSLYESFFSASGLAANARVTGSMRAAGGVVVGVFEGTADGSGELTDFFESAGASSDVLPGYRVTFKEFNGTTLLNTYTVIVPNLGFSSMDKPNAILRGTGPVGKAIHGTSSHQLWNALNATLLHNASGTVSPAGTWALDFGTTPLHGGDNFDVLLVQNANFGFERHMYAPYVYCRTGGDFCDLAGFPFTTAALQIVHGGVTHNFTGKFGADGFFNVNVDNANGTPVFLAAGDKISGTGVLPYLIPKLTTALDYTTDVMSGQAPASRYMDAWAWDAATHSWTSIYTHSNSAGVYAADFTGIVDFVSGEPYITEVFFVLPTTGNTTDYYRGIGP